jgi:hypothetical protein
MTAYAKRTERSQINDLMLQLKLLKKQEQTNPKTGKRREIIKIRAKISEIDTHTKTPTKINETKSWFFEKIIRLTDPWQAILK